MANFFTHFSILQRNAIVFAFECTTSFQRFTVTCQFRVCILFYKVRCSNAFAGTGIIVLITLIFLRWFDVNRFLVCSFSLPFDIQKPKLPCVEHSNPAPPSCFHNFFTLSSAPDTSFVNNGINQSKLSVLKTKYYPRKKKRNTSQI